MRIALTSRRQRAFEPGYRQERALRQRKDWLRGSKPHRSSHVRTSTYGAFLAQALRSFSQGSKNGGFGRCAAWDRQIACAAVSNPEPIPPRQAGIPGLVAATIIGLQALGCAVFAAVFPFAAARNAGLSTASHVMFSLFTALIAAGLGLVARGLWQGSSWPRTAAVVWLAVLLPVGWAMVQAGLSLVGTLILAGAVAGIVAVAAESRRAGT